jgi:formate dehydrogenase subunit delta
MNSIDRLVRMANDIARNLEAIRAPDPVAATADHIAHFWDPRMRDMIFERVAAGGDGLEPTALRGVKELRDRGAPQPQTRATQFNSVDGVGHSDG